MDVDPRPLLHPRARAFHEDGCCLDIIPVAYFAETMVKQLGELKKELVDVAKGWRSVNANELAKALQIKEEQAREALRRLAAVNHAGGNCATNGADSRDVLLFLCIQPYHKRVTQNAEQQLSYLKKHRHDIVTLLAEGDSGVLTMDTIKHLEFLVQFSDGSTSFEQQLPKYFENCTAPVKDVSSWISPSLQSNHPTVSVPEVIMTDATSTVNTSDGKSESTADTCPGQSCAQSLAVYLESAKKVRTVSGLSKNQLVEQFNVRWEDKDHKQVRYTPEGYSIIGGLISHVTNTHLNNKSWEGQITEDMFFVCQGQIHIYQWAIRKQKAGSPGARWKDLDALVNKLLKNASQLILHPGNETLYPLHLENLWTNFTKISKYPEATRNKLATSSKLATYIRCNPAFLSHSQKSGICWHLRRFELSSRSASSIGQHFRNIIGMTYSYDNNWVSKIETHRLFLKTFEEATRNSVPYENRSYDLYRFIRNWHTHGLEPTKDKDEKAKEKDAAMKDQYSYEKLESIAEHLFGSYLSDILFKLLLDDQITDIVAWLSDLKPALPPIQSQDSNPQNKKRKGD